jgi:hypothetical protein
LLAQGRWFSPGTPASSTTKTGRHDIAEILLKVALNTKIQIYSDLSRYVSNFHAVFPMVLHHQFSMETRNGFWNTLT